MVVVSDTSPLNYLLLIDAIDVLPRLYEKVLTPPRVVQELCDLGSPQAVRQWAMASPDWLVQNTPEMNGAPALLAPLHQGESQAIVLALQHAADYLLIDEHAGATAARSLGLHPIGVLGILDLAAEHRVIDLPSKMHQLETQTNFRMSRRLRDHVLDRDRARQKNRGERS